MGAASNYIDGAIEEKLLNLHTAFVAKVLSVNGNRCTVQPLTRIKARGKDAQNPEVITNVPIVLSSQIKKRDYKLKIDFTAKTYTFAEEETSIETGDIVFCLCGERDISEAVNGNMVTPPAGHHDMSAAVVIGIF